MLCKHPISIYIYMHLFIFQMYIHVAFNIQLLHLQSALEVHREKTSPIGCLADQLRHGKKMMAIQNLGFKYKTSLQ